MSAAVDTTVPEEVFYEGSGSQAELLLSLLLAATILYIPLTIASVGKRAWIKYRFTNKRAIIENTSPLFARVVSGQQIESQLTAVKFKVRTSHIAFAAASPASVTIGCRGTRLLMHIFKHAALTHTRLRLLMQWI